MKEFVEKLINELKQESIIVDDDAGHRAVEIIEQLAKEYSANGWIPCSERLPEEKGEYLVTLKTGVVTSAIYDSNENKWVDAMEEYFEYPCIAWQPLPQPYKPQKLEWKDKVMKHFTNVE